MIQVEADYNSTLVMPFPESHRLFEHFVRKLDFTNFHKWALNKATFKQMRAEDIDELGAAFDMKQYESHVSDNAKARSEFLSEQNLV